MEHTIGGILVIVMGLALYGYYRLRTRHGRSPSLRPLPLKSLHRAIKRAAEAGSTVHVSSGLGGLGGADTAETLAGLTALEGVAREANATGVRVIATTANPIVLPVAQATLEQAYMVSGYPEEYDPTDVRFLAGDTVNGRAAYAAGVIDILCRENVSVNVMVGKFTDEYLLMGEVGAKRGLTQFVGSNDPSVLAFMTASADDVLVGEEMYALGAYLSKDPVHVASLRIQDLARILVVGAIILLTIARTLIGW